MLFFFFVVCVVISFSFLSLIKSLFWKGSSNELGNYRLVVHYDSITRAVIRQHSSPGKLKSHSDKVSRQYTWFFEELT